MILALDDIFFGLLLSVFLLSPFVAILGGYRAQILVVLFGFLYLASMHLLYFLVTAFGPSPVDFLQQQVAIFILLSQAIMVSVFRVHLMFFVAYTVAIAIIFSLAAESISVGLIVLALIGGLLSVKNYIVQLVLEHKAEVLKSWDNFDDSQKSRVARITLWLFLPVLFLTWVGFQISLATQSGLRQSFYNSDILLVAPKQQDIRVIDRYLKLDVDFTIERHYSDILQELDTVYENAMDRGREAINETPGDIEHFLEQQQPKPLSTSPCRNAEFKLKFGIKIGLRTLCSGIINGIDRGIQASYRRATNNINSQVRKRLENADNYYTTNISDAYGVASKQVMEARDGTKKIVNSFFILVAVLDLVGLLILISALVGGFMLVVGRVVFTSFPTPPETVNTFQLAKGEPSPLEVRDAIEVLDLSDRTIPGSTSGWYLSRRLSRKGKEAHERPALPQFHRCSIKRLLCGNLLLSYVDSSRLESASIDNVPTISVPGVPKLVTVSIKPGQRVVFHMRNLVAFTNGVKFRSVYSAHMGANVLGLSSFQVTAYVGSFGPAIHEESTESSNQIATGAIVLKTIGDQSQVMSNDHQINPSQLLVWDHRAHFSIAQELDYVGIWVATPDVTLHSKDAAVWHEGTSPFALIRNIGRLLRYMLFPI